MKPLFGWTPCHTPVDACKSELLLLAPPFFVCLSDPPSAACHQAPPSHSHPDELDLLWTGWWPCLGALTRLPEHAVGLCPVLILHDLLFPVLTESLIPRISYELLLSVAATQGIPPPPLPEGGYVRKT